MKLEITRDEIMKIFKERKTLKVVFKAENIISISEYSPESLSSVFIWKQIRVSDVRTLDNNRSCSNFSAENDAINEITKFASLCDNIEIKKVTDSETEEIIIIFTNLMKTKTIQF